MAQYKSPNGGLIVGTAEKVLATAWIRSINDDGTPEYEGESKVYWDTQTTLTDPNDKILFVDDAGEEWTFDQLTKIGEKPDA